MNLKEKHKMIDTFDRDDEFSFEIIDIDSGSWSRFLAYPKITFPKKL